MPKLFKIYLPIWITLFSFLGWEVGNTKPDENSYQFSKTFFSHPWIKADRVTAGADFSLPPHVQPAPNSGIYIGRDINGVSRMKLLKYKGFKGHLIRQVNMHWKYLEPLEDVYRFDLLEKAINSASEGGKYKVELHIKGAVRHFNHFTLMGKPLDDIKKMEESAPLWLDKYQIPIVAEDPSLQYQIFNYDIYDSRYHSHYMELLDELDATKILQNSAISVIYLHNKSFSRGEEGTGPQEGDPGRIRYLERMDKWASIAGPRKNLIMETSYEERDIQAALDRGLGQRNGFIEHYLTHGHMSVLGQGIDRRGYLIVNEEHPLIKGEVASGDENEEYEQNIVDREKFGEFSSFPHRYHESMLRLLQMRRSTVWAEAIKGFINPALLQFVALELGRTVEDAPDAWTYLRESYLFDTVHRSWVEVDPDIVRDDGSMPLKNFERWLYQRDDPKNRSQTVAVEPQGFGGRQFFRHKNYDFDYTARRTDIANGMDRIAFAVEDRFLFGQSNRVALKVTYFDKGSGSFALKYRTASGEDGVRTQSKQNTGRLLTRTYIIDDIDLRAQGMDTDFCLEAEGNDLTVRMVRIIKR